MIEYRRELFGLYSLGRIHGSAVSKAQVPAIFSTLVLIVVVYGFDLDINDNDSNRVINHPYCIQVLVVFMTFLITFRANFAYQRVSCVVQETGRQAADCNYHAIETFCSNTSFCGKFSFYIVLGGGNKLTSHVLQMV
jgi:hypothetical protein